MGNEFGTENERAAMAWRDASGDLGLDVEVPYTVIDPASREPIVCVALVKGFGSAAGSVLLDMRTGNAAQADLLSGLGFFVSAIDVEQYSEYDRTSFADTLNDWGWFGPRDQAPSWYTGKPWS
jgi:hypothetical protein